MDLSTGKKILLKWIAYQTKLPFLVTDWFLAKKLNQYYEFFIAYLFISIQAYPFINFAQFLVDIKKKCQHSICFYLRKKKLGIKLQLKNVRSKYEASNPSKWSTGAQTQTKWYFKALASWIGRLWWNAANFVCTWTGGYLNLPQLIMTKYITNHTV